MLIEYWEVQGRLVPALKFTKEKDAFRFQGLNDNYYWPRLRSIKIYESYADFEKNFHRDQALAKLSPDERKALGL